MSVDVGSPDPKPDEIETDPVSDSSPVSIGCPSCGEPISAGQPECHHCGQPVLDPWSIGYSPPRGPFAKALVWGVLVLFVGSILLVFGMIVWRSLQTGGVVG